MNIKPSVRYALVIILAIAVSTFSLIFIGVYNNNIDAPAPSKPSLEKALHSAVEWLEHNREKINKDHNSALWWMLKEASQITDNNRLRKIYADYKYTYLDVTPKNIWTPYFDDNYTPVINNIADVYPLHDYQLFFIYSLSCSSAFESEPVIQQQLKPDFCSNHFIRPRCVTHQQMAVRFLNKKQCGDHTELSDALLKIIEQEITLDFRVTDSYLQRALMLTDANISLKPIWVSKIIDAQQDDGGWADFYPFLYLGKFQLGTTSTHPAKGPKKSNFHATAQAVWLLTMLINQQEYKDVNK